jgi:IPT/TIG domain
MAQNANTVTAPNPTYPSNFGSVGASQPNPPNYTKNTYNDPKNWSNVNPKDFPPPYYDDGSAGALATFATNIAALASGSAATAGGTEGTYPGTGAGSGSPPTTVNNVGATPASSSAAHEGAGTELSVLAPGNIIHTYVGGGTFNMSQSVSCGPVLTPGTLPVPNQLHASTLSPAANPTLTSVSAGGASGGGNATCTATGTNFTKQSVIYVNGIAYPTTFTSSTTISCSAPKKASAGNLPVVVITGGAVTTAPQNWVFT